MANLCIQNLEEINFFKSKEKKPIMLYKLTHHFVNQRFLPKLANTPDKIRVSLVDNSIL